MVFCLNKLSIDVGDDKELNGNNSSPPQLSTIFSSISSDANQNLDIVGLLNVRNNAFKKCPYSSLLRNKTDTSN